MIPWVSRSGRWKGLHTHCDHEGCVVQGTIPWLGSPNTKWSQRKGQIEFDSGYRKEPWSVARQWAPGFLVLPHWIAYMVQLPRGPPTGRRTIFRKLSPGLLVEQTGCLQLYAFFFAACFFASFMGFRGLCMYQRISITDTEIFTQPKSFGNFSVLQYFGIINNFLWFNSNLTLGWQHVCIIWRQCGIVCEVVAMHWWPQRPPYQLTFMQIMVNSLVCSG